MQLCKGAYGKRRGRTFTIPTGRMQPNLLYTRIGSTHNVALEVVSYHQGAFRIYPHIVQRILENTDIGLGIANVVR